MAGNGVAFDEAQDNQVVICGTSYTLRFSNRAWKALEGLWRCSATEIYRRFSRKGEADEVSFTKINDLLWCALRTHHKEVSMDDVESMLDDAGTRAIPRIFEVVLRTINSGEPPAEVAAAGKRPPKTTAEKSQ